MAKTDRFKYYSYRGNVYRYTVKKPKEAHPVPEARPGRAISSPLLDAPIGAQERGGAKRSRVSWDET